MGGDTIVGEMTPVSRPHQAISPMSIVRAGMVMTYDWNVILNLLADHRSFTADDLPDTADEDVLADLVELGWLEQTAETPPTWTLGWKAEIFTEPEEDDIDEPVAALPTGDKTEAER